jgi:hypothetical protein
LEAILSSFSWSENSRAGQLDLGCRVNQTPLFEKQQECAGRDFATVIRQQKTGAGDLVILEQLDAGLFSSNAEPAHRFLYGEFAEIGLSDG